MVVLDVSLVEISEKLHSEDRKDRNIFVWLSFSVLHCIYWTGVSVHIDLITVLTT